MKNKTLLLIVIIIFAIILGLFKICSSYLFNDNNKIVDGKSELINHLKSIEDKDERKEQIDYSVEQNIITQDEANQLY